MKVSSAGLFKPWVIILAGGRGEPMQRTIERWHGRPRPPQFCNLLGSRTVYGHVLERALAITPAQRVITVVGPGQRRYLESEPKTRVLEQPADRGTAAAVMLAAAAIRAREPSAPILVLPADHFVRPNERFLHHMLYALLVVHQRADRLLVAGAGAASAETDFGWVVPSGTVPLHVSHRSLADPLEVAEFREKPPLGEAEQLRAAGALWSTMIVAVSTETLWWFGRRHLPQIVVPIEGALDDAGEAAERWFDPAAGPAALSATYRSMPAADFSRDLLQACPRQMLVLPMVGVEWNDLGRPERVAVSAAGLAREPSYAAINGGGRHGRSTETTFRAS